MVNEEKPIEQMEQPPTSDATDNQPSNGDDGTVVPEVDVPSVDEGNDAAAGGAEDSPHEETAETSPADTVPPTAVAEMQQEIDSLRAQLDDRQSQFVRMAADFENFRRRTQKEREDLELQIKCATVIELLPVVDNFERARSQIKPQSEEAMSIHKSYQGVYKDLVDRLKRLGVAQMRSEGSEFDPNLHEAVMREPTAEYEEGIVIEELVRGYTLDERVLRHAMVKVAAPPEDGDDNTAEPESEEPSADSEAS